MTKKENIIKILKEYGIILNQEFCINNDSNIYKIDENLNVFKKEDDEFSPLINQRTFIYNLLINDNYTIAPVVVLNVIEEAILSMLFNNGYKYIARDWNMELYAYKEQPSKDEYCDYWIVDKNCIMFQLNDNLFKFIKWEDKNAVAIASLMENKVIKK